MQKRIASEIISPSKLIDSRRSDEDLRLFVFLVRFLVRSIHGVKVKPFDQTFQTYSGTDYYSRMDEHQRHSMFISNVIFEAIGKYKFSEELVKIRVWGSGPNQEELERVIRNAVYTALESEATYHESPSSKLFVDKFVELFPKRWIPAEHLELMPSNRRKDYLIKEYEFTRSD